MNNVFDVANLWVSRAGKYRQSMAFLKGENVENAQHYFF